MKIQSSYLLTELERKKYLCDSFWGTLTLQDLDRDTFKKKRKNVATLLKILVIIELNFEEFFEGLSIYPEYRR